MLILHSTVTQTIALLAGFTIRFIDNSVVA